MYTGMMRELRDNPKTNALYKGIVRLAILQGTYQSPISIKNIIPVEDYASHITPIISGLRADDELVAFAKSNEFQRNEWQDNDVVPIVEPRFQEVEDLTADPDAPRRFQAGLVKVGKKFLPGAFPSISTLNVKSNNRQILLLNTKYNAKVTNYDVVKVPRAISIDKKKAEEGKIDVATGTEITNQTYAEKIKKGDTSLQNYYGYQKVKYADGSPVIASYDQEGNPIYVYKFINLHGDGVYATEFYGDGRPSVFSNGSQKNVKNVGGTLISNEIPDQDIINYYGGESFPLDEADPITATIEKESENVVSLQPSTSVEREFTPEKLTKANMPMNGIFVFGSNTEGRHGKGAALTAKEDFGAIQGQAEGLQGKSYAIVTKDLAKGNRSISLDKIAEGINKLADFAEDNPDTKFYVTKLGSSLAGYTVDEIKEQFRKVNEKGAIPNNVILPKEYEIRSQQPTSVKGAQVVSGKKKELFTPEKGIAQKSFRGKAIDFVDKITTGKDTIVAMSNREGKILIDQKAMEQKFEDKAWTKPAKQSDGSFATPLAENEFGSFNEWLTFALIHETKHDTIKKNEGETTGQYEDRINQAAMEDLRSNYNIPAKETTPEIRYKDKEKRIKIDYPKTIRVVNSILDSSKLQEVAKLTDYTNVFEANIMNYEEEVGKVYGPQAKRYVEIAGAGISISEITKGEGEFFKNNPEFGNELLDAYENDELGEGKSIAEYVQAILDQNEKLTDTAQMSLFDPNNEDLEGADEPNPCGQ
jgi:hypothetical protein